MAVSAYASLVSLTHVLDNLHYRAQFNVPGADINQIEMLQKNVEFLLEFVELHSERKRPDIEALWRSIADATFAAEDTINFHVVNLLHLRYQGEPTDEGFSAFCEEMERVIQKLHSIKEELPEIKEDEKDVQVEQQPVGGSSTDSSSDKDAVRARMKDWLTGKQTVVSVPAGSSFTTSSSGKAIHVGKQYGASVPADGSFTTSSGKDVVVGLDEHVLKIRDQLIMDNRELQILPIVGMGGIGKTTLAKIVFDDSNIVDHFDRRIWLTISQEFNAVEILKGLLDQLGKYGSSENLVELGEKLYKELFGRRYLIVMDDMWTTDIWNELNRFFPTDQSEGCILLTTRLSDMAASLGSTKPYLLSFLDKEKCWDLFCQNAFGQVGCPHLELETLATDIAKSCKGLPLEIVVIARFLANSDMTELYFKSVLEDISSFRNLGDDEYCLNVLSLSYKSLPLHLKPCFLYMRVFHEDAHINKSDLIQRWIAEGFIKRVSDKSLEDTAFGNVKCLIDRNLIFTRRVDYYGIHDLLRDFCIKESINENFIQSPKVVQPISCELGTCFLCRQETIQDDSVVHLPCVVHIYQSTTEMTFACDACKRKHSHIRRPIVVMITSVLKKEAHVDGFHCTYRTVLPTELRIASFMRPSFKEPTSLPIIHFLWNLQTLDIDTTASKIILPPNIWEMPQLRHIYLGNSLLPVPVATYIEGKNYPVLKNLKTLFQVRNFNFTKQILNRIPNLKSLTISYDYKFWKEVVECRKYLMSNLQQLQKLEDLCIYGNGVVLENITFPNSLRSLILRSTEWDMAWDDMSNVLGSLPNLEKLELRCNMKGSEWNLVEGQFQRLKDLTIDFAATLLQWTADDVNYFPVLEHLSLFRSKLSEIPSAFGCISTLQSIKLFECNDSVLNSAQQVWEEQHECGNDGFWIQVRVGVAKYEIDDATARRVVAANLSLAYLEHMSENLLRKRRRWNREGVENQLAEKELQSCHVLKKFVEDHAHNNSRDMDTLRRHLKDITGPRFLSTRHVPESLESIKNALLVAE